MYVCTKVHKTKVKGLILGLVDLWQELVLMPVSMCVCMCVDMTYVITWAASARMALLLATSSLGCSPLEVW